MKGRHSTITYEQAIELARDAAREAVREELSQLKRNSGSGLLGAIVSTTDPRMDGHITLADVFVSAAIPVGFTGFGIALAAGAMLAGAPFDDALTLMGRAVQVGGGLGALRLVGDALNLGGLWHDTIGIVLDRVEKRRESDEGKERTRLIPYQGPELVTESLPAPNEMAGIANKLYELAHDMTIRNRELWQFLDAAFSAGDWTRSGWCGGDGKPGRGMPQPLWYALRDALEPLGVWGTRDRPTLESFVKKTREP